MTKVQKILYVWAPPFLWMGVIFVLSAMSTLPSPDISWLNFFIKKSAHVVMYAFLFFWWQRAFNWGKPKDKRSYGLAIMLSIGYAFLDEYHQSLVPGRTSTLMDVGFDALGVLVGYVRVSSTKGLPAGRQVDQPTTGG